MRFLFYGGRHFVRPVRDWVTNAWQVIAPGARAWRGAGWGALTALALIVLATAYGLLGSADAVWLAFGALFILAVFALVGSLLTVLWRIIGGMPAFYVWVLSSAAPVLAYLALVAMSVPIGIVAAGSGVLAAASLIGGGIGALRRGGWRQLGPIKRWVAVGGLTLGLMSLIGGGIWLLDDGTPLPDVPDVTTPTAARVEVLDLPDPSQPGQFGVQMLFYGSGQDRHRPAYGPDVDLVTAPVDGAALIERWSALRTVYWGFGSDAIPLNGRVWYPEGEGPFPLVVMVHGQHPMEDFSDPGYAYLGELLASRGYIAVSVDENFLNLSPLADLIAFQSLIGVDDLRGWLLLEHVRIWRDWNGDPDSPFYQQVDLDRIALIGHSRGGAAVAVAAAFNKLAYYPDDASVRFDYGFGIRSVVAFAPVDGTYQPAGREIDLTDVNYLVLQGAHDMDVFTFQGDKQYSRVYLGAEDAFKAAVYIYGANHGQFNTCWGRKDLFEPVMRVFNLAQLMPGEDQRQIAKVTVSAFLEATLKNERGYRALFQDLRRGQVWLPDTVYLTQYQDARTRMVCTHEEDIDLGSTTLSGGRLSGEGLAVWREQPAEAKWEDLGDQTVYLGWDANEGSKEASYVIDLPERALALSEKSILVFSMADAGEDPAPEAKGKTRERSRKAIDLTVAVMDSAGNVARLPLSHFSLLSPQLEGKLGKAGFMSLLPTSEVVLQHFEFPLGDFVDVNPAFDPAALIQVRLLFDRTEAGVIVLDDIGFREG